MRSASEFRTRNRPIITVRPTRPTSAPAAAIATEATAAARTASTAVKAGLMPTAAGRFTTTAAGNRTVTTTGGTTAPTALIRAGYRNRGCAALAIPTACIGPAPAGTAEVGLIAVGLRQGRSRRSLCRGRFSRLGGGSGRGRVFGFRLAARLCHLIQLILARVRVGDEHAADLLPLRGPFRHLQRRQRGADNGDTTDQARCGADMCAVGNAG